MKLLPLLPLPILLISIPARAQKLFGYVLEQNSGKKPVPGAVIKSASANQIVTADNGSFTLTFQNAAPGDYAVLTIEKEKWIITEKNRLEVNLPLDPFNHPHTVIMCRADVWAKENQQNLQLLNKILNESLQKQKAALNKQRSDYQRIVDSLDEQYVKSQQNLGEMTEALSRVNRDDVSETEKAAYAYFAEGKIEEAVLLRQTLQSEKNLLLAYQRLKQLEETKANDSGVVNVTAAIALHRRNLKEEINLAKLQFDWRTAERKLKFLADNDSGDHENLLSYGEFLESQNEFAKAETVFKKALNAYTNLKNFNPGAFGSNLASVQYHLGTILTTKHQYTLAENFLKESFGLYAQLANKDSALYSRELGNTLRGLGVLHREKRLFSQAEKDFNEAIRVYKALEHSFARMSAAAIADVQNNLGLLYLDLQNYPLAESCFKKALAMRKTPENEGHSLNEADAAEIDGNLGNLYLRQKKYDASKVSLQNALTVFKKFQATSPAVFEPLVGSVETNLGLVHTALSNFGYEEVKKKDSAEAHHYFEDALNIARRLASSQPEVYEPALARTSSQAGFFYSEALERDSAELYLTLAIEIYERFAGIAPEAFNLELAATMQNLAKVYLPNKSASSEILYKQALAIYKSQSASNVEQLDQKITDCLYDLAALNYNSKVFYSTEEKDFKESLRQLNDVLQGYNRLNEKSPGQYSENIKSVQNMIARVNRDLVRLKTLDKSKNPPLTEGEKIERELNYLEEDIQEASTNYNKLILSDLLVEKKREYIRKGKFSDIISFGHDLNALSWYLLFSKKYPEAEKAAREAVNPGFKKPQSYDEDLEYANANLAISLLLQNKYEEAKKVYASLKGKSYDDKTYVSMFLDDIAQLEKAGITHPDFEKIRNFLVE